jgi:DNA-binding CsgD family transcriptional regulator
LAEATLSTTSKISIPSREFTRIKSSNDDRVGGFRGGKRLSFNRIQSAIVKAFAQQPKNVPQVAQELQISIRTVEGHCRNILTQARTATFTGLIPEEFKPQISQGKLNANT